MTFVVIGVLLLLALVTFMVWDGYRSPSKPEHRLILIQKKGKNPLTK